MNTMVSNRDRASRDTYAPLINEYRDWCLDNGFAYEMSADELECELAVLDRDKYAVHRAWLRDFIERWDAAPVDLDIEEVMNG